MTNSSSAKAETPMSEELALDLMEQEIKDMFIEGMSVADCNSTAAYVLVAGYKRLQRDLAARDQALKTEKEIGESMLKLARNNADFQRERAEAAEAQVARMREFEKDARRYAGIKEMSWEKLLSIKDRRPVLLSYGGSTFDEAIDQALTQPKEPR